MNGSLAMPTPSQKPFSPLLEREAGNTRTGRSNAASSSESLEAPSPPSPHLTHPLALEDGMMFLSYAAQALSRDEFSRCFEPRPTIQPTDQLLYLFYLFGVAIRYGLFFPLRLTVLLLASFLFLLMLPLLFVVRDARLMRWLFRTYCHAWLFSFSALIRHHGRKPSPSESHLFVANHTSFIDYFLISSNEAPHATVAQVHGGLFGWFQRHALSLNGSLFFNRSEQRDRLAVSRRMQAHIDRRPQGSPLIIFPEGTCVNNESTVLFHKGAFELEGVVCPVAIKYNKRLLDPYWNTREQSFTQHALYLMTRWLMIADVWWLPPQRRAPEETAIQFANRVKALISETAGLRNLSWDGYMKNCMQHKDQEKMRKTSQANYVSVLKRRWTPRPAVDVMTLPEESAAAAEPKDDFVRHRSATTVAPHVSTCRRRANSLISDPSSSLYQRQPADPSEAVAQQQLYLPSWLSEKSIVDIKNELIINESSKSVHLHQHHHTHTHNQQDQDQDQDQGQKGSQDASTSTVACHPSLHLLRHIRDRREGIVQTWRYYSRANRQSPPTAEVPETDSTSVSVTATPQSGGKTPVENVRLENSSWRMWFRQRQAEGQQSRSASGQSDEQQRFLEEEQQLEERNRDSHST